MSDRGPQRAPLVGGFYVARSKIANAQRCVNLYPERNPDGAPSPFTDYPTPGLTLMGQPPTPGPSRGLYTATNGQLYHVVGQTLYAVSNAGVHTVVGALQVALNTPVSIQDNGVDMFVVDGSLLGYIVHLATNALTVVGAAQNFLGADAVDYVDTFFVFNQPLTKNYYSTLSNSTTFDPTFVGGKTGAPDQVSTLIVMHREIWLLGAQATTEIHYNAGGQSFPFAILPGVFIQHGCIARYSVARYDLQVFWIGIDEAGTRTVFTGKQYAAQRISTPAIAHKLRTAVVSDAIGMVYKIEDHVFYVLTFPTSDFTLVYDVSEDLWHEWVWTDGNGQEHRCRASSMAVAYDTNFCGDWQLGSLYKLDFDNMTDNGLPIVRRRTYPHIMADAKRVSYELFIADMETGNAAVNATDTKVFMRYSVDRGRTWSDPVAMDLGTQGSYITLPQAWKQGLAYDIVYELFWSAPQFTALNGAFVDFTVALGL